MNDFGLHHFLWTIDNSFSVLAIQVMAILQAIDYLECQGKLSSKTSELYDALRKIFPVFIEDQPKYKDLEKVIVFLETTAPPISFYH